jgi:hypothetical protein
MDAAMLSAAIRAKVQAVLNAEVVLAARYAELDALEHYEETGDPSFTVGERTFVHNNETIPPEDIAAQIVPAFRAEIKDGKLVVTVA